MPAVIPSLNLGDQTDEPVKAMPCAAASAGENGSRPDHV
jgi:hypothetical protein